jgi:hypothetical protein
MGMWKPVLRIRDVYPGSRIMIFTHPGSRISDPGSRIQTQQQKRWVKKKFDVIPFYVATNFTNFNIILVLKCWRKKFGPIFIEFLPNFLLFTFYPKNSQKYGFGIRDQRSGIRKKPIPDPGSRGQKGTGSGSATLVKAVLGIRNCIILGRRIWIRFRMKSRFRIRIRVKIQGCWVSNWSHGGPWPLTFEAKNGDLESWGSIDVPVSNLSQGKWVAGNESTACEMPLCI